MLACSCFVRAWSAEGGDALRHGALRRLPGQEEVMQPRWLSDGRNCCFDRSFIFSLSGVLSSVSVCLLLVVVISSLLLHMCGLNLSVC
jgi:hypothetical protein